MLLYFSDFNFIKKFLLVLKKWLKYYLNIINKRKLKNHFNNYLQVIIKINNKKKYAKKQFFYLKIEIYNLF